MKQIQEKQTQMRQTHLLLTNDFLRQNIILKRLN